MTGPVRITREQISDLCERELAWVDLMGIEVERLGHGEAGVRLHRKDELLRPGGTVCGPAMMGLADFSMYVAVLTAIGLVPLAVTTSLNINFLRKPRPADILAEARLLKLGRRLAYGEVSLVAEGQHDAAPVAHATCTYSIPPDTGEVT